MTLNANNATSQSSAHILSQTLDIGCKIVTPSSYAKKNNRARPGIERKEIGRGFQGAVFEQPGTLHVLKKENPGNRRLRTNIRVEHILHELVSEAFDKYGDATGCEAQVPRPIRFFERDELGCPELARFPDEHSAPDNAIEMERILPMPKAVRKALLSHFQGLPDALDGTQNKHCLVRTYLGQAPPKPKKGRLDVHRIAESMGAAFAIMHWGAGVDGGDVEFVLGTRTISQRANFVQERDVGLFILDFGHCKAVNLTKTPAKVYSKLTRAMVTARNQMFVPDMFESTEIYLSFRDGYTRAANLVLQQRGMDDDFDVGTFLTEYEQYVEEFL